MVIVGALCLRPPGPGEGVSRSGSVMMECDSRRFQEIGIALRSSQHSPRRRALASI